MTRRRLTWTGIVLFTFVWRDLSNRGRMVVLIVFWVLAAFAGRLRVARGAFGPEATGPLLVAGADALQRGVGAEALRGLGEQPGRSPMAVLVLAELVETGVPAERALGLVREAMQRRAREQQMLGLPAQVRRLMQQGRSPQEAVEQVRRALARGRGGGVGPPVPPGSEPVTRQRRPPRGGA